MGFVGGAGVLRESANLNAVPHFYAQAWPGLYKLAPSLERIKPRKTENVNRDSTSAQGAWSCLWVDVFFKRDARHLGRGRSTAPTGSDGVIFDCVSAPVGTLRMLLCILNAPPGAHLTGLYTTQHASIVLSGALISR
jgi:hypothetical protein